MNSKCVVFSTTLALCAFGLPLNGKNLFKECQLIIVFQNMFVRITFTNLKWCKKLHFFCEERVKYSIKGHLIRATCEFLVANQVASAFRGSLQSLIVAKNVDLIKCLFPSAGSHHV